MASRFRRILFGSFAGAGLYFGPFLPSPLVWHKAIPNLLPGLFRHKGSHTHRLTLGPDEDEMEEILHTSVSKVSVVIPVYNEGAENLIQNLERLDQSTLGKSCTEVIVVDAGCSDDTMEALVKADMRIPVRVLRSKHGRGQALSAGAESATGDILLFLHADTLLPTGYDEVLRNKLADKKVLMTAFSFEINVENAEDSTASFRNGIKRLEYFTNIRARNFWLPYGDQALAMRRSAYKEVGGVKRLKMMEDFELVSRVRRIALENGGRIEILPEHAKCSPRRWEKNGIAKNSVLNWTFVAAYVWAGISPDTIFEYYYK
eukprot:CAMPEP_0204835264 /NCGR_PEP_ID=MMETSP1346-20131115/22086_1 /ASSEMBLY_ACC=CAM_ASM_000771 /TAXON_ID=215587 /ORGANISM="Aplanochytrium stocchinoi, Strain GSBS06" /LENGTH=316 /DNA_ID=CAMNT_0051969113 /DNA_START=60 /DNA_END=1010 /DNA_ORIENTATION=+